MTITKTWDGAGGGEGEGEGVGLDAADTDGVGVGWPCAAGCPQAARRQTDRATAEAFTSL
jgi:hypothetical protein